MVVFSGFPITHEYLICHYLFMEQNSTQIHFHNNRMLACHLLFLSSTVLAAKSNGGVALEAWFKLRDTPVYYTLAHELYSLLMFVWVSTSLTTINYCK